MNRVCCGAVRSFWVISAESGGYHGKNHHFRGSVQNEHDHILRRDSGYSTKSVEFTKNTTVCRMRQEDFEKFVMQNRKKYNAFNLSAAFIDCGLLISASEHDQNDPPYQVATNNVNTS